MFLVPHGEWPQSPYLFPLTGPPLAGAQAMSKNTEQRPQPGTCLGMGNPSFALYAPVDSMWPTEDD